MNLTERQYKFLLDATQMISRVFGQMQQEDPTSQGFVGTRTDRRTSQLPMVSDKALQASSSSSSTAEAIDGKLAPMRFRMALQMPTIEFEVYTDSKISNSSPPVSLSRFALNGSSLQVRGQENGSIEVGWQVHTLTVDDTRPDIHSKFRHIVPVMQSGHQFLMQCDLSPPSVVGGGRHGIVLLTINEPKMIVSLDHVFMLYQFFTTPTNHSAKPSVAPPPLPRRPSHHSSPTTTNDKKTAQQEEEEENGSLLELSYRLNVTNVEFILLADPDAVDSEAVVLSTEKIMISHQSVMALAVKKMGMFLCRIDSRDTSTLRFIQPFDISISMNNNNLSEGNGGVIELEVDVDALVLRLSYRDAMLVTSIFNKAYDLYNKYIMSTTAPTSPRISYAQTLLDQATTSALQFATQTKESVIRKIDIQV
jgi:vacuolar protein sorting-associated protein 13A/C